MCLQDVCIYHYYYYSYYYYYYYYYYRYCPSPCLLNYCWAGRRGRILLISMTMRCDSVLYLGWEPLLRCAFPSSFWSLTSIWRAWPAPSSVNSTVWFASDSIYMSSILETLWRRLTNISADSNYFVQSRDTHYFAMYSDSTVSEWI